MRILYLCADPGVPILGRKGCSTHVREVVKALIREGHAVRIVCANRGEDDGKDHEHLDIVEIAPLTSKRLGFDLRHLLYNRRFAQGVREQIASFKPDALYERFSLYSLAGHRIARRSAIPRLLEVNAFLSDEQQDRIHFPKLARWMDGIVVRHAQEVVVVSDRLKQDVARLGLSDDRIHKMPMCADTEHFTPEKSGAEIRQRFNLQDKYVIGYVGTLTGWHGISMMYDVAEKMRPHMRDFVFLIVGGDEVRVARHREKVRELNLCEHFVFVGSVPYAEVPQYIRAMDVTLVPDTTPWSSPTKLYEYQASGVPTVAPRYSSIEDAIDHGVEGMLFEPKNADDLAERLIDLSRSPERRQEMGQKARKRVEETHSIAHQARRLTQIYERMSAESCRS